MPLDATQKAELEAVKTRLQEKYREVRNTKSQIKKVIECADGILQDDPQDRELGGILTATRLESLRQHVLNKSAILAPVE